MTITGMPTGRIERVTIDGYDLTDVRIIPGGRESAMSSATVRKDGIALGVLSDDGNGGEPRFEASREAYRDHGDLVRAARADLYSPAGPEVTFGGMTFRLDLAAILLALADVAKPKRGSYSIFRESDPAVLAGSDDIHIWKVPTSQPIASIVDEIDAFADAPEVLFSVKDRVGHWIARFVR